MKLGSCVLTLLLLMGRGSRRKPGGLGQEKFRSLSAILPPKIRGDWKYGVVWGWTE